MEGTKNYNFYDYGASSKNKMPIPSLADPGSRILSFLQSMGVNVDIDSLYNAADYPTGSPEEFLRHYFFGYGNQLIDFMVWVDIGVGWELTPKNFASDELGQKVKAELDEYFEYIDLIGTMIQFATYFYVLGKAAIVFTQTLRGDEFYYDKLAGVTGVDAIDPISLDENSIRDALKDITGKTPFKQKANYEDLSTLITSKSDNENSESDTEIELARDRVIFRTRNPLSRVSPTGFSSFQNCVKDLQTAAKFPRYRNQLSSKYANLHRHYVVNTEMLKTLEGGLDILKTKEAQDQYLLSLWDLIKKQMDKGSTVITFDFIESHDISFGGKEPDLAGIEKQTYEAIAFKIGVPLNLTGLYGFEINRATLDTIAQFFVDRRKNGPQRLFKDVLKEIIERWMKLKGYVGGFDIEIRPFLNESKDAIYNRALTLDQANVPRSDLEKRREVGYPDEIEWGKADEEREKKRLQEIKIESEVTDTELEYITLAEDDTWTIKPDLTIGEGTPTPEEVGYRTELLAGLAIAAQNIREAAKQGFEDKILRQKIDKELVNILSRGEELVTKHLSKNRQNGLLRAREDLRKTPLPTSASKVKLERFNKLQQQQRDNLEDITAQLRGKIRQTLYMRSNPQVIESEIKSHVAKASQRLDAMGAWGGVKAQEDAYLDVLDSTGRDLWVDLYPVMDKRTCKTCIGKARSGPYRLSEVDSVGNGNPEHPHCRCRWGISERNNL